MHFYCLILPRKKFHISVRLLQRYDLPVSNSLLHTVSGVAFSQAWAELDGFHWVRRFAVNEITIFVEQPDGVFDLSAAYLLD